MPLDRGVRVHSLAQCTHLAVERRRGSGEGDGERGLFESCAEGGLEWRGMVDHELRMPVADRARPQGVKRGGKVVDQSLAVVDECLGGALRHPHGAGELGNQRTPPHVGSPAGRGARWRALGDVAPGSRLLDRLGVHAGQLRDHSVELGNRIYQFRPGIGHHRIEGRLSNGRHRRHRRRGDRGADELFHATTQHQTTDIPEPVGQCCQRTTGAARTPPPPTHLARDFPRTFAASR